MIEAPAGEHRPLARNLDSGHLKRVQDGVRTDLDEGMSQTLLLEVDGHARPEDAVVEADQPVHVGGDERQVMNVVEQLHVSLRPRSGAQ